MSFRCEHLSKSFAMRDGFVQALDDVTFGVGEREFVSIVGPSGCGKTTLLKLIAGLLRPSAGSVVLNAAPDNDRPASALVFQEHGLFPWMTVLENVAFGLETRGVGRSERHERAMTFIASVGLASFAHAFPHQLSVGMRQRVGIGRAFVTDPRLLLLDEPLGSLDAQTRFLLQEELLRLWTRSRSAVVYVTHDIEEAVVLGDRVLVLTGRPGRIQGEITVPLGRPRKLEYAADEKVTEIKWQIWKMLEEEARRSLALSSREPASPEEPVAP
jgi:NitT/TauT family transport system ATP-binding protein